MSTVRKFKTAQLEVGELFTNFVTFGCLNQRPIHHLNRNGVDLASLLNYKTDLTPLGQIMSSEKQLISIDFNWDQLPEMTIHQLLGVYSLYLFTMNAIYNKGRKVYPLKNGKAVLSWTHHKIADQAILPETLGEFKYTSDDVYFIQNSFNSCCTFNSGESNLEPITAKAWFKRTNTFKLAPLFNDFNFGFINKSYTFKYSEFAKTLHQLSVVFGVSQHRSPISLENFTSVVEQSQMYYVDNQIFLELIKAPEYNDCNNYNCYLSVLEGFDPVYYRLKKDFLMLDGIFQSVEVLGGSVQPEHIATIFSLINDSLSLLKFRQAAVSSDKVLQDILEEIELYETALKLYQKIYLSDDGI